jgi:hypothetical protein
MMRRILPLWIGLSIAIPSSIILAQQPLSSDNNGQGVVISGDIEAKIVDGYGDSAKTFDAFINTLKQAIEKDDAKAVATMVHYPIKVGVQGKLKRITSLEQLVNLYSKVFTKFYKKLVLNGFSKINVMSHGIMLGDGSLWMSTDERSGKWKIIAINNG